MHRRTRLSATTFIAAGALVLPAVLCVGTAAPAPAGARSTTTDARIEAIIANVGHEGAAEHEGARIKAIIANVGHEGAAEHEGARILSRGRTSS